NRAIECRTASCLIRGCVMFAAFFRDAGNQMSTIQASAREGITAAGRRLPTARSITPAFTAPEGLREVALTSRDIVNLVLAGEGVIGVSSPKAEIAPATFRWVATVEARVGGLRHRSAA